MKTVACMSAHFGVATCWRQAQCPARGRSRPPACRRRRHRRSRHPQVRIVVAVAGTVPGGPQQQPIASGRRAVAVRSDCRRGRRLRAAAPSRRSALLVGTLSTCRGRRPACRRSTDTLCSEPGAAGVVGGTVATRRAGDCRLRPRPRSRSSSRRDLRPSPDSIRSTWTNQVSCGGRPRDADRADAPSRPQREQARAREAARRADHDHRVIARARPRCRCSSGARRPRAFARETGARRCAHAGRDDATGRAAERRVGVGGPIREAFGRGRADAASLRRSGDDGGTSIAARPRSRAGRQPATARASCSASFASAKGSTCQARKVARSISPSRADPPRPRSPRAALRAAMTDGEQDLDRGAPTRRVLEELDQARAALEPMRSACSSGKSLVVAHAHERLGLRDRQRDGARAPSRGRACTARTSQGERRAAREDAPCAAPAGNRPRRAIPEFRRTMTSTSSASPSGAAEDSNRAPNPALTRLPIRRFCDRGGSQTPMLRHSAPRMPTRFRLRDADARSRRAGRSDHRSDPGARRP